MNYTLQNRIKHLVAVRLQLVVLLSWLGLAELSAPSGQPGRGGPEEQAEAGPPEKIGSR